MKVKQKGNNYEREISRKLSIWFSEEKYDDVFWRTSGSGSRSTVNLKNNKITHNEAGDLSYKRIEGKNFIDFFLVECKVGYSPTILDVVNGKSPSKNKLVNWFNKAYRECTDNNRIEPLVIFKGDRKRDCVVIRGSFYNQLVKKDLWKGREVLTVVSKYIIGEVLCITSLEEFLFILDHNKIRSYLTAWEKAERLGEKKENIKEDK